jgi:ComF family protein
MLFEKENLSYIDSYRIFSSYDKALKEMIIALKFKKASLFANIIADIVKDDFFAFLRSINPDIVTYVPVSFLRFWQRGYDQNAILLKALNAEYISIFKRIKHAKPLSLSIDKNQREHIVSGAFKIKKEFVFNLEGKKVLVFDDILTTGATATQIAKTLKMHAVKEVYFYFIASHKRNIDMV